MASPYLEDPNLLKLRSLDSTCPYFPCAIIVVGVKDHRVLQGQTGVSPEFRATWLSRREKKGHFQPFSAYFPVLGATKGRRKTRAQPWYARKSGNSPAPQGAPRGGDDFTSLFQGLVSFAPRTTLGCSAPLDARES